MKTKREICLIGMLFAMVLLIAPQGWAQRKPETTGATIINAFAVDEGYYGCVWKIYLEGEDPKGQMLRIACSVDQPGFGHYPTDWIYLKPEFQKHFRGYIQWNTFSSNTPTITEGAQIMLRISILDKAGRGSKEVVFPFTFRSEARDQVNLPAPFDQGVNPRLGHIHIDLYDPDSGHGNAGGH
jgi:hypothetical protein